ncbi:MAG: RnfABCDGE type electron transport complex subunit D [Candidatus Tectimicrobiota bacterium]
MPTLLRMLAQSVRRPQDPRLYQIAVLSSLLLYGVLWLDFAISLLHLAVLLSTVLLTQALCQHWRDHNPFDPRSALISGLSLCLLLRTNAVLLVLLTAVLAIASKYLLRWRGKHLFNPTNLALVLMLSSGHVWVSAGQWGSTAFFAFLLACCGGLVVYRASRSDVTYAFLIAHLVLRFGRAWWLGDPLSIPLHQLQNGALVLFAFFMISDPRTTPDSRLGRLCFAGLVAWLAWYLQFTLYWQNALLWALAGAALAVPLLNWCWPGRPYVWASPSQSEAQTALSAPAERP